MEIKDAYGEYTVKLYPVDVKGTVILETDFLMHGHTAHKIFPDIKTALVYFGAFITTIAIDLEDN